MTKVFKVENLDCANCAAKIEKLINALTDVKNCSLSFLTGRLTIEADESNMESIAAEAKKIVKKVEANAVIR